MKAVGGADHLVESAQRQLVHLFVLLLLQVRVQIASVRVDGEDFADHVLVAPDAERPDRVVVLEAALEERQIHAVHLVQQLAALELQLLRRERRQQALLTFYNVFGELVDENAWNFRRNILSTFDAKNEQRNPQKHQSRSLEHFRSETGRERIEQIINAERDVPIPTLAHQMNERIASEPRKCSTNSCVSTLKALSASIRVNCSTSAKRAETSHIRNRINK